MVLNNSNKFNLIFKISLNPLIGEILKKYIKRKARLMAFQRLERFKTGRVVPSQLETQVKTIVNKPVTYNKSQAKLRVISKMITC